MLPRYGQMKRLPIELRLRIEHDGYGPHELHRRPDVRVGNPRTVVGQRIARRGAGAGDGAARGENRRHVGRTHRLKESVGATSSALSMTARRIGVGAKLDGGTNVSGSPTLVG